MDTYNKVLTGAIVLLVILLIVVIINLEVTTRKIYRKIKNIVKDNSLKKNAVNYVVKKEHKKTSTQFDFAGFKEKILRTVYILVGGVAGGIVGFIVFLGCEIIVIIVSFGTLNFDLFIYLGVIAGVVLGGYAGWYMFENGFLPWNL